MAKKQQTNNHGAPPDTLDGHPFYGLDCSDPDQKIYRDALWDRDTHMVIVDAVAGSGKTQLAVAVACMYVQYGICDEALYIRTPSSEGRIGFLPGDKCSKEKPYMQPLYDSLINIGMNPITCINDDSFENQKTGEAIFTAFTDVYILGSDYKKKFVIIDESQCMTKDQLKAIITRCHDDCYICIIGSSLQVQGISEDQSGLKKCINHFKDRPWCKVCHLTKNYRGEMSAWADLM